MAQVKFFRGVFGNYKSGNDHKDAVYFSTDTQELFLNGVAYGISKADAEKLDNSVKGVELANGVITVSYTGTKAATTITLPLASSEANGLMSKEDKAAFDVLNGSADVAGSVKKQVADALASATSYADGLVAEGSAIDLRIDAIEAAMGEDGSVSSQIDAKINALDVTAIGGAGKIITTVSETDGKIAAEVMDATAANIAITNTELEATNVEAGLAEIISDYKAADAALKEELMGEVADADAKTIAALNDKIEAVGAAAKSYEIVEVTEGLSENVRKAYKLVDEDKVQAGSMIEIYKDSSLKSVALNGQTLNFTYILADGSEDTVGVDVSAFLAESEFGNGLQVVDHVVSVKVDGTSESYLSVSADGIKVDGIDTAISNAVTAEAEIARAAEKANSDAIKVLNGTATEAGSVAKAVADAKAAIDAYTVNGQTISGNPVLDSADIKRNGKEQTVEAAIAALETAVGAEGSVANQIKTAVEALDAEVTSTDGSKVTVKVTEVDGKITAVNVTESDIASAQGLADVVTSLGETGTVGAKIKANADAIATLNGNAETAGSVAKALADAKAYTDAEKAKIDAYTVNEKAISSNPVLDATDIKLGTYTSINNSINITATTTIADAIKALEDAWTWGEA